MDSHKGDAAVWRCVLSLHRDGHDQERPEGNSPTRNPVVTNDDPAGGPQQLTQSVAPHIELDNSPESRAAATQAAMAHVLARPDSIRQRAQSAAAISSAAAVALTAAAIAQLTGNGDEVWAPVTIGVVSAAVVLWIVSVWRFIHVVTLGPQRNAPSGPGYQRVVDVYEEYSDLLREQLRSAGKWSALALAATAVAVGLEIGERVHSVARERQIVLTPGAMSAVASLCGWGEGDSDDRVVNVRVSSDELSKRIVDLQAVARPVHPGGSADMCDSPSQAMSVPRTAILGAREIDGLDTAFTSSADDRTERLP